MGKLERALWRTIIDSFMSFRVVFFLDDCYFQDTSANLTYKHGKYSEGIKFELKINIQKILFKILTHRLNIAS